MPSDALLSYYEGELAALRELAAEFARVHPRAAGRLRLTGEAVEDPHVERLLEGTAFLAARVQQRLDDEVPELSDALLELLAPGLLWPVPSMTTLRLSPRPDARAPVQLPRGQMLATEPVLGEPVRFSLCYDTTLWPLRIEAARLAGQPFAAPPHPLAAGAAACLQISLRTPAEDLGFADLGLDRLRLHLTGGSGPTGQLYELLAGSTLGVALAGGADDPLPTPLGPEALRPVGFAPEEAVLPWPRRSFAGHRLLAEYFAFPQKFLYFDLDGLERRTLTHRSDRLEVFVYLSRAVPDLERAVGAASFALGCTPAANVFPQRCEPITLDGTQSDWLVLPDAARPDAFEVCGIESVRESRPDGSWRSVLPFYRLAERKASSAGGAGGGPGEERAPAVWLARRLPAPPGLRGTEMRLALRDPDFDPAAPADATLTVEALCCNRDLPEHLPFGAGQPSLSMVGAAPVGAVECLSAPTPTLRPGLRDRSAWRLISHLSLNHLSVAGGEQAAMALREMLRLHDLRGAPETAAAIAGLVGAEAAPGIARLPKLRPGAFARGLDVTLTFEAQAWRAGGLYLLAAVLERFLALQASINAFVRTRAVLRGRAGLAAEWPARSGTRALL